MPTSRKQARRSALFALYQWDLAGQQPDSLPVDDLDDYARGLAEGVAADAESLDDRITAASEDWTADRLGTVERNVLRIALHELGAGLVPAEVAVDEAVRLSKRYASDDAARLVNGILGRVLRERAA
ncbi:MAG: transcription antitermination factor NusB [Actinomycetota bacterium]|nr:transcription antitermination factor NusB [Actinomycetota bacterium]